MREMSDKTRQAFDTRLVQAKSLLEDAYDDLLRLSDELPIGFRVNGVSVGNMVRDARVHAFKALTDVKQLVNL